MKRRDIIAALILGVLLAVAASTLTAEIRARGFEDMCARKGGHVIGSNYPLCVTK